MITESEILPSIPMMLLCAGLMLFVCYCVDLSSKDAWVSFFVWVDSAEPLLFRSKASFTFSGVTTVCCVPWVRRDCDSL